MLVHLPQLVDWQHRESRGGDRDDCAAIALHPAPARHGEAHVFIEQLALGAFRQTSARRRPVGCGCSGCLSVGLCALLRGTSMHRGSGRYEALALVACIVTRACDGSALLVRRPTRSRRVSRRAATL
jgi:hypothetical protein